MAASDARPVPRKNTAYRVTFPILDADGDLVSAAASLDSEVSKDAGNFADCTSEATEIQSTGIYYLDLTADEMNADTVVVQVKTGTAGAKTTVLVIYPEEAGDLRVDVVQVSGDTTAADNLESACDNYSATRGLAGTALPAAAADAAGGLVISDAGGLDADAQRADVAAILVDTGTTLDGRIPAALTADGNIKADTLRVSGTVQTAGDLGAGVAAILDDTGTSGVVVAAASKTGYALGAAGLDSISTTAPAGVASNFREMIVQTWRRWFKKTTATTTQVKTYADNGTDVLTTQTVSDSSGTETLGAAS